MASPASEAVAVDDASPAADVDKDLDTETVADASAAAAAELAFFIDFEALKVMHDVEKLSSDDLRKLVFFVG
jgi:hypothetical protein